MLDGARHLYVYSIRTLYSYASETVFFLHLYDEMVTERRTISQHTHTDHSHNSIWCAKQKIVHSHFII